MKKRDRIILIAAIVAILVLILALAFCLRGCGETRNPDETLAHQTGSIPEPGTHDPEGEIHTNSPEENDPEAGTEDPSVTPSIDRRPESTAEPSQDPQPEGTMKPTDPQAATQAADPAETPEASKPAAPTAVPTAKPTAAPTAAPTERQPAKPTATPTAKPTAAPTAAPTAKPTAAPTAKPTATPTQKPTPTPAPDYEYPWSDEVMDYLTDETRYVYILPSEVRDHLARLIDYHPNLAGTIFANCTSFPSLTVGESCVVEDVNEGGVITQLISTKWYDQNPYNYGWRTDRKLAGVYLDADYVKPNAKIRQHADQTYVTETLWGVEITRPADKMFPFHSNFFPAKDGSFVLEYGCIPIILNKVPKTIYITHKDEGYGGLLDFQIAVDGHVVYEVEELGTYAWA